MHNVEFNYCRPPMLGRLYPEERKSAFILAKRFHDVEELRQVGHLLEAACISAHSVLCMLYLHMIVYTQSSEYNDDCFYLCSYRRQLSRTLEDYMTNERDN